MLDALKTLFENDVVSAEVRQEIEEAWEAKIKENKLAVTAELREEFAQKYEHDKNVMVEAVDKMVTDRLESEMAEFDEEEKKLLLKDYGIKESGLDTLIKEAYNTLGLETFFTCGEKEVRAWTMKKGSQAVEAAGEIHTDFSTKFIKAEIYTYDDAINNEEKINELKTLGLVKMVGRDYIMQEGDIAYFIKGQ